MRYSHSSPHQPQHPRHARQHHIRRPSPQIVLLELAGPHQRADGAEAHGGQHILAQVVADHQRVLGRQAERTETGAEEGGAGLAEHRGAPAGGVLQAAQPGAGVELRASCRWPPGVAVHRHQLGAAAHELEGAVERGIREAVHRALHGSADHDQLRVVAIR